MKLIRPVVLFFVLVASVFAERNDAMLDDVWVDFADPYPIRSAVSLSEDVLLATDGGIRVRSPEKDILWASASGLGTSSFYGLVNCSLGLFAVSEFGIIANYDYSKGEWNVLSRSFEKNGVRLIPDMAAVVENIMVLAFEDRIAFFDLVENAFILTLKHMGNSSLATLGLKGFEIRGDSLYVQLRNKLYVRNMDWRNVAKDLHLIDSDTWKELPKSQFIDFEKTTEKVVVHGKTINYPPLYSQGKSVVKWTIEVSEGAYLVGSDIVVYCSKNGECKDISKSETFGLDGAYELVETPIGGVVAASASGYLAYGNGRGWNEPIEARYGLGNMKDAYGKRMKVLSLLDNGQMFYHVWGYGFMFYSEWGKEMYAEFSSGEGGCMDEYLKNYTIAIGTSAAPDQSGFLSATATMSDGYGLVYLTKDGEMSCISHVGTSSVAGPIVARMDENGSDWKLYISTRELSDAYSQGGLDIFTIRSPKKNGGRLEILEKKHLEMVASKTPVDMAIDEKNKILWLVSVSDLAYMEFDQDTIKAPKSVKGLFGAEYSAVDVDVHGNVWLGSSQQGAFRLSRKGNSPDTLSTKHFTTIDGLLSNEIDDVAIDPVFGMAWFAHPKGVSRYRRADLRDASEYMTDSTETKVKSFPNPFRPLVHGKMCIDNISENSTVSIYNRGGKLVKFFRGEDVYGGRVLWDGKTNDGKYAAPGVYYYFVKSPSKKKKGKFILIH